MVPTARVARWQRGPTAAAKILAGWRCGGGGGVYSVRKRRHLAGNTSLQLRFHTGCGTSNRDGSSGESRSTTTTTTSSRNTSSKRCSAGCKSVDHRELRSSLYELHKQSRGSQNQSRQRCRTQGFDVAALRLSEVAARCTLFELADMGRLLAQGGVSPGPWTDAILNHATRLLEPTDATARQPPDARDLATLSRTLTILHQPQARRSGSGGVGWEPRRPGDLQLLAHFLHWIAASAHADDSGAAAGAASIPGAASSKFKRSVSHAVWTEQRVAMVAVLLGRLGLRHGPALDALVSTDNHALILASAQ